MVNRQRVYTVLAALSVVAVLIALQLPPAGGPPVAHAQSAAQDPVRVDPVGPDTVLIGSTVDYEIQADDVADLTAAQVTFTAVAIDVKPGSDPNSINCENGKGIIPVAILTTEDFDATTVDHTTATFEGASETHVDKKSGEPRRHEEDVDGDGDTDLVFHFRLGDTGLTCSSTEGTLVGAIFDGQPIEGSDAVHMVGDEVEDGAPNDGNGDGVLDSQQAHVTSLPNSADGRFVTLATLPGLSLAQVMALPNPSPADAPSDLDAPLGFFSFQVEGLARAARPQ